MGINLEQYQWSDMRVELASVRGGSYQSYKGGEVLKFPNAGLKIYFTVQMDHDYALGTALQPHAHMVFPNSNAGNVEMVFTYSWADIHSDFPAETTDTQVFASPQNADSHRIFGFDDPDPIVHGVRGVSSVLICSLERTSSAADTYGSDVYMLSFDFHYLRDSNGSRFPTSK